MNFNTLFQKAITSKKYQFDTETYIEENPDFEQPAKYLESLITPITTERCIDDIITVLKDSIIPMIMHDHKHLYFDMIKKKPIKSYQFFGNLAYLYLYENHPYIRKYIHPFNMRENTNRNITSSILKMYQPTIETHHMYKTFDHIIDEEEIFKRPNHAYCRVDDGSFGGFQFEESMSPGNNVYICSTTYDKTLRTLSTVGLYDYKVNGKRPSWVFDHDTPIDYRQLKHDQYGNIRYESYKDQFITVDGEYKVKLEKYNPDSNYLFNLYVANVIPKIDSARRKKNDVMFLFDEIDPQGISELHQLEDGNHEFYQSAPREQVLLSTLEDNDNNNDVNQFYFEHKYPDLCSITQTPLRMPTYTQEIVDADDIDKHQYKTYSLDYSYNHQVSMLTGTRKKQNVYTGMYVNDQSMDDLVGFYRYMDL